jgi:hypothetical protein
MNEINAKRSQKQNSNLIRLLPEVLEAIKRGEVESFTVYVRYKDGDSQILRSYSDTPEADAGELMGMAMDRLGFSRRD